MQDILNVLFDFYILVNTLLFMLILMTQFINYPLFNYVSSADFSNYHIYYTKAITYIVAPLMISELIINSFLLYIKFDITLVICQILILIIWLSTIFIQVPIHNKISNKYNIQLIERLIKTNWIRTISWLVKLILLIQHKGIL